MTRLTKSIREKMAKILLKHRFKEEGEALAAKSVDLFELVYADKYDAETRKHMAAILKRNRSAFANMTCLSVNVMGRRFNVGERAVGKDSYGLSFTAKPKKPHPVFNAFRDYDYLDCAIAGQLKDFSEADVQFSADIVKAYDQIMAVLGSFSTERALTEGWPDAIPLIGHVLTEAVPGTSLPAVLISRINQEFGIPAIEAAGQ